MWIITDRGFYSAVQHRKKPDRLLIRARNEDDIRALADLLPDSEPWSLENSDYEWRLECSKQEWSVVMAALTDDIDYDNFKNAVGRKQGKERSSIYMGVWSKLLSIERKSRKKLWSGWSGHGTTTGSIPIDGGRLFELDADDIGFGDLDDLPECDCYRSTIPDYTKADDFDYAKHGIGCSRGDELELIYLEQVAQQESTPPKVNTSGLKLKKINSMSRPELEAEALNHGIQDPKDMEWGELRKAVGKARQKPKAKAGKS